MTVQLYPHQTKALEETKQFNRVGYFLDMGLGKTFVGSEKVMELETDFNVVVCQHSKIDDWVQHFKEYYPDYWVLNLTNKKEFKQFFECYEDASRYEKIIGVINYELIFRRADFLKLDFFTMMLDESSMITNPTAKRTKFIHKMNPDNVILLSGTPTGGKYEKLWSQLRLLGWGISKDLFFKQYVVQEWIEDGSGFKIPHIVGYKNVE